MQHLKRWQIHIMFFVGFTIFIPCAQPHGWYAIKRLDENDMFVGFYCPRLISTNNILSIHNVFKQTTFIQLHIGKQSASSMTKHTICTCIGGHIAIPTSMLSKSRVSRWAHSKQVICAYVRGIIPRWLGIIPCPQGIIPSLLGIRGFLIWLMLKKANVKILSLNLLCDHTFVAMFPCCWLFGDLGPIWV